MNTTFRTLTLGTAALFFLAACGQAPSQDNYLEDEVGVSRIVSFATVLQARPVKITGKNSGNGALAGGAVGAGTGAYIGQGSGSAWAMAGGAAIGAVAGALTEQNMKDHQGIEYVLTKENGKTITLVQEVGEKERVFKVGERVMIQTSGSYQRVLPAEKMPETINRPKGVTVVDPIID